MLDSSNHRALKQCHSVTQAMSPAHQFDGHAIHIIAGPCAVESAKQITEIAHYVAACGVGLLRGGVFKPRTNPHSFQGLGLEGLRLMAAVARQTNMRIVTELMDVRHLDAYLSLGVDVIQVGSRNMQNYDLLRELGRIRKPILLKRGLSAKLSEWLDAAEYIAIGGNQQIIFCERGIRTFEPSYRNVLDVSAIPTLKQLTGCPVIADPSHASGRADLILPLARAAIAAGADGIMIETHPRPEQALSDKEQAINQQQFHSIVHALKKTAKAVDRQLNLKTTDLYQICEGVSL